jgi:hypothetical protein
MGWLILHGFKDNRHCLVYCLHELACWPNKRRENLLLAVELE